MRHQFLSVLFVRESGGWVAQALEHDIAAQGATFDEARIAFERAFTGQVHYDRARGREPLAHIKPAPQVYWDAFATASKRELRPEPVTADDLPPAFMVQAITNGPLDLH